jgi:DNA-binding protein HU-beta
VEAVIFILRELKTMNKGQLIEKVAESGFSKKDAELAVNAIFGSGTNNGVIIDAIQAGDKVELVGFGSFSKAHRNARKGRNPQTGQEVDIAETNVPKFKPGNKFKDAVK